MNALLIAFAFSLAAMAPVVAAAVIALVAMARWRPLGVRALVFALACGIGVFVLWFAEFRQGPGMEQYPALVAFGAGFTAGGVVTFLWHAARGGFARPDDGERTP